MTDTSESITLSRKDYNDALAAAVRDGASFARSEFLSLDMIAAALHVSGICANDLAPGQNWDRCPLSSEHEQQAALMQEFWKANA